MRVRFHGRLVDAFLLERRSDTDHVGQLGWLDRVISAEPVLTGEVRRLVDAVAADRESVALAEDLYVHGLGTYLNVLVAERSQYASEEALVQVEQMLIVDLIATYKALGGGWEATADEVASR